MTWTALLIAVALLIVSVQAVGAPSETASPATTSSPPVFDADRTRAAALALLDRCEVAFRRPDGLIVEHLPADARSAPAFVWPMTLRLDALVAAARVAPARRPAMVRAIDELDRDYRDTVDGHLAYRSGHGKQGDTFYDDNAWIVLAMLDAYEITKDPAHLRRAKETLDFLIATAIDDRLGGGVWWMREQRRGKNTCSTAPTAFACLRMYEVDRDPKLLELAKRLVVWTDEKLRDPVDGLYFDNISSRGRVNRTKFSYNTAVMILTHLKLFAITGDASHHERAIQSGRSGVTFWMADPKRPGRVTIRDDASFARWWMAALLDLARAQPLNIEWIDAARAAAADRVATLGPDTFQAKHFHVPEPTGDDRPMILMQGATVRLLLDVAARSPAATPR